MINTLIIIVVVMALLHFIYDGIIAPSIRRQLNFKLFALRDELRTILINDKSSCDDDVYSYIQSALNVILKYAIQFDAFDVYESVKAMESNPDLEKMAKNRLDSITNAVPTRMSDIHDEAIMLSLWMMLVNMGGLVIYLVPILVVMAPAVALSLKLKTFIVDSRIKATTVASIPETEISKIIPQRLVLAVA